MLFIDVLCVAIHFQRYSRQSMDSQWLLLAAFSDFMILGSVALFPDVKIGRRRSLKAQSGAR